jgi:hypothetical protein
MPTLQSKIQSDPYVRLAHEIVTGEIKTLEEAGRAMRDLLDGHSSMRDVRRRVREVLCIYWTNEQVRTVHSEAMRYLKME